MLLNPFSVLRTIEIFLSVILVMQTFEYFALRKELSANGLFPWRLLKADFESWPSWAQVVLDLIYKDRIFEILLTLRILLSGLILYFTAGGLVFASLQLILSLLIMWRWRGAFNGGSDFLALLLLVVIWLWHLFPGNLWMARGGLWYIALQVCLSYFVSGYVKIKSPTWRSGEALRGFLQTSVYENPSWVTEWITKPWQFRFVTWLVMAFELAFPLSLIGASYSLFFMLAGLVFHTIVHFAFGLNRFFWIWLAAYPALYFASN
jgi:hypothetical protein